MSLGPSRLGILSLAVKGVGMHLLSVVGARPQFIKLAPVAAECDRSGVTHTIVHTGQHYDFNMSDVFFDELRIPTADRNLNIGSDSHGRQTARMLDSLEETLMDLQPDWVLAYGDTNSTLASAVAAVKLHIPLAHLEAGLRSFNRTMPEEHNRVLTDHAADLLLVPSKVALSNLHTEGLGDRSVHVGDVMVDVTLMVRKSLDDEELQAVTTEAGSNDFILATIHRAENTDDPERLREVIDGLASVDTTVLLPAHPRLRARAASAGITLAVGSIRVVEPLPYRSMIAAIVAAKGVVTDSGGLQKEAYVLGTPCTTLRTETEWSETLEGGWNVLVPDPRDLRIATEERGPLALRGMPYGAGNAAGVVLRTLADRG